MARHLERGDKYVARQQYREATLEYRHVLRVEPSNIRAVRELALAYFELGEFAQAFGHLLKAQELAPDDRAVRLKLGAIYLVAGKRDAAREEAVHVLDREPSNLEALSLLAGTASTPEEIRGAIKQLNDARGSLGDRAKFYMTLGVLHLREKDEAGAEQAFRDAVTRDPKSVEA